MSTADTAHETLPPELEAIGQAGHDRLQAVAGQDLSAEGAALQRVAGGGERRGPPSASARPTARTSGLSLARGGMGLSHREIAEPPACRHRTVRAILIRLAAAANGDAPTPWSAARPRANAAA